MFEKVMVILGLGSIALVITLFMMMCAIKCNELEKNKDNTMNKGKRSEKGKNITIDNDKIIRRLQYSCEFLKLFREITVIILGAFVALYLTNYAETQESKESALRELERINASLYTQCFENDYYLDLFVKKQYTSEELIDSFHTDVGILEHFLEAGSFSKEITPYGYLVIYNSIQEIKSLETKLTHENSDVEGMKYMLAIRHKLQKLYDYCDTETQYIKGELNIGAAENAQDDIYKADYSKREIPYYFIPLD